MAALAPRRDGEPSKPGEEKNTGRAEVNLPRPRETEAERGRAGKVSLPRGASRMWSNLRPGVETLGHII